MMVDFPPQPRRADKADGLVALDRADSATTAGG